MSAMAMHATRLVARTSGAATLRARSSAFTGRAFTAAPGSKRGFRSTAVTSMALKTGIVGLPNVGKSTLFNALVENSTAEAANYPFCTIEPNSGILVEDFKKKRGGKKAGAGADEGDDEGEGEGEEEENPFDTAPKGPKLSAKRLAAIGFVAKDDGKKKKAPAKKKAAPKKKK